MSVVGALGAGPILDVEDDGTLEVPGARIRVWVGDESRWRRLETEPSRRAQQHPAPVSEHVVAVVGGDAHVRVFAATEVGTGAILEVENSSAAPVVVGIVVEAVDGRLAAVDHGRSLQWSEGEVAFGSAPRRHASRPTVGALFDVVQSHQAAAGAMVSPAPGDRAIALFPLPHRQRWRAGIVLGRSTSRAGHVAPPATPTFAQVLAGWRAALARGMQVEPPDDALAVAVDRARAVALVASERSGRRDGELGRALEDWGLDDEAAAVWSRLGTVARRRARRPARRADWAEVRRLAQQTSIDASARLLVAMRSLLLRDERRHIELLGGLPAEWSGAPVSVTDAPTRAGPVSFALRWHGDRPALLWDTPEGVTVRAPALDAGWEHPGGRGETLLAPLSETLLRLTTEADRPGTAIDDPGSFA